MGNSSFLYPKISRNGCMIDIKKLKENEDKLTMEADRLHQEMIDMLPPNIKSKYKSALSLTRADIIIDYMFNSKSGLRLKPLEYTPKTKKPNTGEAHLKNFSDHIFVEKLLRWKKMKKLLSTYITSMYNYLHSDGRVYPQTFLYRTVTGRTAMTRPPIQQIPQRGIYVDYVRELFIADKGWLMGTRDLSQSELRIMAWLANEKRMLDALKSGVDLHRLTASLVIGGSVDGVSDDNRQKAKAINFGLIYGQSAKGFKIYAKDEYGVSLSLEEAEEFRNRFFSSYPSIVGYHRKVRDFVHKNGYLHSPLGRKRRLFQIFSGDKAVVAEAERQAINFRIQSFSSDLGLLGLTLFQQEIDKNRKFKGRVKILWFIHDAIFFIAMEDVFEDAMKMLKKCIEYRTAEYIYRNWKLVVDYPIETEGKMGPNWASLEKIE
jgi:DNA polymerase-1